jgi:hypothetical protein
MARMTTVRRVARRPLKALIDPELPLWAKILVALAMLVFPPLVAVAFVVELYLQVLKAGMLLGLRKKHGQWVLILLTVGCVVVYGAGHGWQEQLGEWIVAGAAAAVIGRMFLIGILTMWTTPPGPFVVVDPRDVDEGWRVIDRRRDTIASGHVYARWSTPEEAYHSCAISNKAWKAGRRERSEADTARALERVPVDAH